MRATKIIGRIKNMSYIERLKHINLPTLKCKRLRGYMIKTYKIINEKYDDCHTRESRLKLKSTRTQIYGLVYLSL